MASAHEEYLYQDDSDAVLNIIESDFLEYGDEFQQDMNLAVEKIPTRNNSPSYPCSFCAKVCLSKGGLTRHISTKHHLETAEPNTKVSKMLHPYIFHDIIQKTLKKFAQDECYPEEICSQFSSFRMSCSVADLPAYNLITPVINSFNGDAEKFYPNFYKVFVDAEHPFRGLDLDCTRLLGFEIANHILVYIPELSIVMMLSTSTVIPSFLPKKNHLLHVLVVMFLEHFIAEYVSQKQPIKIKLTINSAFPF